MVIGKQRRVIALALFATLAALPGLTVLLGNFGDHTVALFATTCGILAVAGLLKLVLEIDQSHRQQLISLGEHIETVDADLSLRLEQIESRARELDAQQKSRARELDAQQKSRDSEVLEITRTLVALHESSTGMPLRGR